MKRALLLTITLLLMVGVFASAKSIDQEERISIEGISKIIVDDTGIKGAGVVINNLRITINVFPEKRNDVIAHLHGEATANNKKCLPGLDIEKSGDSLTILLERCKGFKFFIVSRGEITLDVHIPETYEKDLAVRSSNGRVNVGSFNVEDLSVSVSSGALSVDEVTAQSAEIKASSGDIAIASCTAGDIKVRSSSGRIEADVLAADRGEVTASSGSIRIGKLEGDFSVKTSSGKIRLDEAAGNMEINTSSGDVKVLKAAGDFEVDSSSGDVETDFEGNRGTIFVDSSSGTIIVEDLDGSASLNSSSGRITAEFADLTDDSTFDASSGDITIILPKGQEFTLDIKTSSGRVDLDFPITVEGRLDKDDVYGTVGSGGPAVKVKTSSGNVELRSR